MPIQLENPGAMMAYDPNTKMMPGQKSDAPVTDPSITGSLGNGASSGMASGPLNLRDYLMATLALQRPAQASGGLFSRSHMPSSGTGVTHGVIARPIDPALQYQK